MKLGFKFGDHFVHYFVKPFSNNFMTMVLQFVLSHRVHLSAVSKFKEHDEFRRSQNPSLSTRQPFIEVERDRRVEQLKFTVMFPSEIMEMAEVEIFRGVYYGSDRKPIEAGLLGPPNKKCGYCATCGANYKDCPGHFGYLALALPVYNVGYMGTVVDILKCICKSCSGVLLKEEMRVELLRRMRNPKLGPLKKTELMKMVVKQCNGLAANNRPVECSKCGYLNGSVKKATGMVAIIHDRSKFDGVMDELRSTIPETKVSSAHLAWRLI